MALVQRPVPVQRSALFRRVVLTADDILLISTHSFPFQSALRTKPL